MKRSRRQILKLLAAGSAATLAGPAAALVDAAARPRTRPTRPVAAAAAHPAGTAVRAEVEKQKRDLRKALKTLRDTKLPDGSEAAFVFHPTRARRGARP